MPAHLALLVYLALVVVGFAAALGLRLWPDRRTSSQCAELSAARRRPMGGRRALALLLTWSLTTGLILVSVVSSAIPTRADNVDLLRTTTPSPEGFSRTWECKYIFAQQSHDAPFDGNDATYCEDDLDRVDVNYSWADAQSHTLTITSFRAKVAVVGVDTNLLGDLYVLCGDNESGNVGRPEVFRITNIGTRTYDTGVVNLATPCQIISNTGHAGGGLSLGGSRQGPGCCSAIGFLSFEAYSFPDKSFLLGGSFPYTATSPDPVNLVTGSFTHQAEDLALPGRLLGLNFTRWYNSAEPAPAPAFAPTSDVLAGTLPTASTSGACNWSGHPPGWTALTDGDDATFCVWTGAAVNTTWIRFPLASSMTITEFRVFMPCTTVPEDANRPAHPPAQYEMWLGNGADLAGATLIGSGTSSCGVEAGFVPVSQSLAGRSLFYKPTADCDIAPSCDATLATVSAHATPGEPAPFGPGWTHTFNWRINDYDNYVTLRRGDGRRDTFTRNVDGTYATPPDTFDRLVRNGDATYTLTETDQVQYEFSAAGRLARIHEPAGNQITLTYSGPNLTAITDSAGRQVTLTYDASYRLTQLQDPIGRKVTYGYDANGRLASVTDKIGNATGQDPLQHQWKYAYDGTSQHLTTITDPDGRVRVTNVYDSLGRVYQQRDGLNKLTSIGYDASQTTTTVTDPRSHTTTYTFDARGRVLSQSDVVSGITYTLSYTYDAQGNRKSVTDRNGKTTDFTYDAFGNVLTKTDPQVDSQIPRYLTQYHYDAKNNLDQLTDARNFVTTYTYDPATNVKLSMSQQIDTAPTYAVTKWEYGDAANPGLPTKVISPRGNTGPNPNYTYSTALSYDTQGNLIQKLDADGNKTTYGYDGVGRQTSMVDPDGYVSGQIPADHTWTTSFDENDRVTKTTDPLGHFAQSGYDGAGNRASDTDRNGNVTSYSYDSNARLQTVQQKPDPLGQPTLAYTTQVGRDDNGNATQVTQANGVLTDYGYDELNRLTSVTTHPAVGTNLTTSYVLDGNGNATARTTADNVTVSYGYDALSRLTSVSAPGLTTISYGYDELSRRTSMVDGTGTSTYSYDGLSRLTQATQPNGTLSYGYDLDSNRTTLGYPSVGNVTYVFSPAGRLSSLTDWGSRQSSYTYTAAGLAKTVSVPGGMTTTYTYDRAQRLTSVLNATASQTISSHTYTLDSEGNRTALDEQLSGAFASVKVNSDTGTPVHDHPAIGIGADGATYLVWDDARNGNADIFFSRRDPASDTWSANVKVNTDTGTRTQANPAISLDSSSNAYAVWDDFRDGTNNQNIYYAKRTASNGSWSTPNLKVNDGTGNTNERNPRIAGTSAGAETAVWVDLRSGQNNIYSSTLAAGGSSWAANKRVTDNTAAAKDFPDVAVGTDGTSYAVWQDSRNGNADIFFSSLASGGSGWAANTKISDDPGTAAQTKARIGVDGANNLIAAWIDARTTPARVRAARRPSGGAWSASVEVSPAPANVQSLALSVRSDGYAWAVWGDTRGTSQDIYGSRYDPYLNSWSTPVRLDDDPGTVAAQLNPAIAFTSVEVLAAWRDNRRSANGDAQARRLIFVPGLTEHFAYTYDGLNRLTAVTGSVPESIAFDGASNIATRTGPSQTDSYDQANRLTSDGSQNYTWSNADRLISRGSDTFTFDAVGRLTGSTVAGIIRTYAYNGDGLLQRRVQGSATTMLWDPATTPSRLVQDGSDAFVYGLGALYAVRSGATVAMAPDGESSIRSEVAASGTVSGAFRYRAYGSLAQSTTAMPSYLGYVGELPDPSGLYYLRARWYEPVTGRFLIRDAVTGTPTNPASLNEYSYAAGNPIMLADPLGLDPYVRNPCNAIGMSLGDCRARPVTVIEAYAYDQGYATGIAPFPGPNGVSFYAYKAKRSKASRSSDAAGVAAPPGATGNWRKVNPKEVRALIELDLNPEELKGDVVGGAKVARYDVYVDKRTGDLAVFLKSGRGEGEPLNINLRDLGIWRR